MTDEGVGSGCGCSDEPVDAAATVDLRRPDVGRRLAVGMLLGAAVPVVVGCVQSALHEGGPASTAMVHATAPNGEMVMLPATGAAPGSWLGSPEWFYGAMLVVLAFGAGHALVRKIRNSCGSTPLGMGIMWGSMAAMAFGMAVGLH